MKIYLTRHGQTDYNKKELMQGRTDIPLNETGLAQAKSMQKNVQDIHFNAVYSSPLSRAVQTAQIISGFATDEIIRDERIIEVDFGPYETMDYHHLGPMMTLFWMYPEIIPAPKGVEPIREMVARTSSFVHDLSQKEYDHVLVVCHGGIIRALRGAFEGKKNGIVWRPRPLNCEMFVYEKTSDGHVLVDDLLPDETP